MENGFWNWIGDAVDEILLKIIDAPIARERKGWWRSEER